MSPPPPPVADVVLDPDTAHPSIVLSADYKQAGRGELLQIVPDNPKRFDPVICVVARNGFLSGRFYFQVGPRVDFDQCWGLSTGFGWCKDLLGPGSGQRVGQQEGDDHLQTGERVLDSQAEGRERVLSPGLAVGPPVPPEEASDYRGVCRL